MTAYDDLVAAGVALRERANSTRVSGEAPSWEELDLSADLAEATVAEVLVLVTNDVTLSNAINALGANAMTHAQAMTRGVFGGPF